MRSNNNLFHPNYKLSPENKKGREGDIQEENEVSKGCENVTLYL